MNLTFILLFFKKQNQENNRKRKNIAFILLFIEEFCMDEYNKMLERAYLSIPKEALKHERFEIPRADSLIQGKKTIVKGFSALLKDLRRDKKHFLKYLMKETGAPITENANALTISGKVNSMELNKIISNYFSQFVLCAECGKPDTKIISEHGTKMMKCEACGALAPVKGI